MDKANRTFQKIAVSGKFIMKGISRANIRILQAEEAGASVKKIEGLEMRSKKLSDAFQTRVLRYVHTEEIAHKAKLETANEVSAATLRALKGRGHIGKA